MTKTAKMSYGDVLLQVSEDDDTPLYNTNENLHDWYLAHERNQGSMISASAHKAALYLVKKEG